MRNNPTALAPLALWIQAETEQDAPPPPDGSGYIGSLWTRIHDLKKPLRKCYRGALKKAPAIHGEQILLLTLNADGRVTKADIELSTVESLALDSCGLEVFRQGEFAPPPQEGFRVRLPVVYTSERTSQEVFDALCRRYQLPCGVAPVRNDKAHRDDAPW